MKSEFVHIDSFEKIYNNTLIVIAGGVFFVLAICSIALLLEPSVSNLASDSDLKAEWVANGAAILLSIAVIFLRRILFSRNRLHKIRMKKGNFSVIKTLQTNTIFLGILAELVALIGFVTSIGLTRNNFDTLRLSAVSLLLFLIIFPRKSKWRDIISASERN